MPDAAQRWLIQLIQASQGLQETGYLPYSVGLLQAYVLRHAQDLRRYTFLPLETERLPIGEQADRLGLADVYGFSVYVWNIHYSLALAAAVKARRPDALIVFGGPQVPDRAEAWLRAHPQVDVCVHGEGERVFLQLLESLPARDWRDIAGISWLDAGAFRHHPPGARIRDLDEVPSPYLMGLFDSLLALPQRQWVPLWETNRGCPFSCTFCDWGSATAARVNRFGLERLLAEIDWFADRQLAIINCCDANFGILPRDAEIAAHLVASKARTGYPREFFMQGTKNTTERAYAIQKQIIDAGLHFTITLSMQAVNSEVLKNIRRENISLDTYRQLQHRFHRDGVETYTDLLIGLPGETYTSFTQGICTLMAEGQHHWLCFYGTYLLPNAELAQPESRRRFGLQSVYLPYSEAWLPVRQEVPERQEMLIASDSYSVADWRRMRCFAWWVQILYYHHRLLQLPLLLLHELGGLDWLTLLEHFSEARFGTAPMLQALHGFLTDKATAMSQGEAEHCVLPHAGQPTWVMLPHFVAVGLSRPGQAESFFAEAGAVLQRLAAGTPLEAGLLAESLALSQALFLQRVRQQGFDLPGRFNLWEWYQARLRGEVLPLTPRPCRYTQPAALPELRR